MAKTQEIVNHSGNLYAYDGEQEHEYVLFDGKTYRSDTGKLNFAAVSIDDIPVDLEWETLNPNWEDDVTSAINKLNG
ncbi:hypothetical protein CLV58_12527 [Spirosoma oryzae]|uniref:Uncharacterized protein n=1 Tax=Spirosoma oryzae TaxID=1469603 RepID=A0A2T0S8L2_9BACT|nr:hypothetical protein [Spirosoma oryzae]PRY29765.1 hypothetical protein CLV58_12527 [Spirosoma oryzae]